MAVESAKLPVWQTAANAYLDTFAGAATLLRVAIIPFCLAFFAGVAVGFVAGFTGHAAEMAIPWSAWNVVGGVFQWFFTAVFAVAWHRYVLLPPERVRTTLGIDFTFREAIFFAYAVTYYVIIMGPNLVARSLETGWLFVALALWPIYMMPFIVRFSMVLPAAAIERRISFVQAWAITKGLGWRIGGIAVACGLPLGLTNQFALPLLLQSAQSSVFMTTLVGLTVLAVNFLFIAVATAGFSLTYRWIMENTENASAE